MNVRLSMPPNPLSSSGWVMTYRCTFRACLPAPVSRTLSAARGEHASSCDCRPDCSLAGHPRRTGAGRRRQDDLHRAVRPLPRRGRGRRHVRREHSAPHRGHERRGARGGDWQRHSGARHAGVRAEAVRDDRGRHLPPNASRTRGARTPRSSGAAARRRRPAKRSTDSSSVRASKISSCGSAMAASVSFAAPVIASDR
jgi:hypothetical protein